MTLMRMAIVGCGSSGLICLKTALAELPGWQVVCFEKSSSITGCWGNPYPGFVSTSTKYTTQFACFPERDASIEPDAGESRGEFYRDAEYGEYLNRFADAFALRPHIRLGHKVERLSRHPEQPGWQVTFRDGDANEHTEHFSVVVICTGLAAEVKGIESAVPAIPLKELNRPLGIESIRNERIVVFGGGESAVDFATRLSQGELGNKVYLSLRTGVRVSPRYHPIRGVPSDFLRNRLMLSIDPGLRNAIGERFVRARIRHRELFEKWFPARGKRPSGRDESTDDERRKDSLRKEWAFKLTKAAKDDLFNMFHNKSDDFLDRVAEGRIEIIGPPTDSRMNRFHRFQSEETFEIEPTRIVPAIGYRSTLSAFEGETLKLADFYLGCCHVLHDDLFLIGFARPIIGNIPTISEMQAALVCGLITGRYQLPERIAEAHALDRRQNAARFAKLDLEAVYPVEMFTYCDRLARLMNAYPSVRNVGSWRAWWRMQLSPATTAHYHYASRPIRDFFGRAPVYMPTSLILFLLALTPVDWLYRAVKKLRSGFRPSFESAGIYTAYGRE